MMNMLELLCRAGSPMYPVYYPARVLSFALGIDPNDGIAEALEEFERRDWVTLQRDHATSHILSACPTPEGMAVAAAYRSNHPLARPLARPLSPLIAQHDYADS